MTLACVRPNRVTAVGLLSQSVPEQPKPSTPELSEPDDRTNTKRDDPLKQERTGPRVEVGVCIVGNGEHDDQRDSNPTNPVSHGVLAIVSAMTVAPTDALDPTLKT